MNKKIILIGIIIAIIGIGAIVAFSSTTVETESLNARTHALALVLAMEGQADRMWGDDLVEEAAQTILENRRVPPTRCDD